MKWVKAKCRAGILGRRFRAQPAVGVEIMRRESCALQGKRRFIAPMAARAEAAGLGFSAGGATHYEKFHRRFLVGAVFRALEPMIEPAQSPVVKRQCRFGRKLDFAGDISTLTAMRPRSDDQLLRRFLAPVKHLP